MDGAANADSSTFSDSGPGMSAVPRSPPRLQETRSVLRTADAVGPARAASPNVDVDLATPAVRRGC